MGLAEVSASPRPAWLGELDCAVTMELPRHTETPSACAAAPTQRARSVRASAGSRRFRQCGLTLVEIILIVAIVAILASLAATTYRSYRDRINIDKAVSDIMTISFSITEFTADYKRLPVDLAEVGKSTMVDPWGQPYRYVNHATAPNGQFRKDKNIVPINSDFDLWSSGKDGASVAPLTAAASRDDIIRANDGAFIGLASVYDP
jgi:general secretion pathway protein G